MNILACIVSHLILLARGRFSFCRSSYWEKMSVRREPSDEIFIEELFADDLGYDADVETVQPDAYEEPASDTESLSTPKRKLLTIDEDLAARMKHLGSDRSGTNSPTVDTNPRGRKRRSLYDEDTSAKEKHAPDLEITELPHNVHYSNVSPPRKRRKRSWLDSSSPRGGRAESQGHARNSNSISSQKQAAASDGDIMDMT